MHKIIVVNQPQEWDLQVNDLIIINPREYLTNPKYASLKNVRVFNLSQEYRYQSRGYYVSLLAEARGHKPLPDVKNILDMKSSMIKYVSQDLEELIQKSLKGIKSKEFIMSIYFGRNTAEKYGRLSSEIHKLFQAPLLRAKFIFNKKWILQSVKTIGLNDIPESHIPFLRESAALYFNKKRYRTSKPVPNYYDLAILVDPADASPPSDKKILAKFAEAGEELGFRVDLIEPKDFNRLEAYDALFIRMTTHVNNESYRFARRAQAAGLALIDYPELILKCTNKVYLKELMDMGNVPIVKTMIVHQDNKNKIQEELNFPCVLKLPDSAFSLGVHRADDEKQLKELLAKLFQDTDLVVAQEYVYTEYDWRIGVLDGEVLFACQYFMADGHWQVYNWDSKKKDESEGRVKTFKNSDVPGSVLKTALKACSLINKLGLFGVDIKMVNNVPLIVEINDNPSIETNSEDAVIGDELYRKIIKAFRTRIEEKAQSGQKNDR